MSFSTLPFLFYFLPAFLAVYYIVPARFRNAVLALGSLLFYWLGAGTGALLVLVALILVNFAAGRLIEDAHGDERRAWLILALACDVGSLFYFKYMGWFLENLGRLTNTDFSFFRVALPLGVSFYVFQSIAYVADVYRGDAEAERSLLDYAAFQAMFPQLVMGPILRLRDVSAELHTKRPFSRAAVESGFSLFVVGLGCKVVLANEEVVNGVCERCGSPVVQRVKSQWMLKITAYADKLIDGLDGLDYIERVATQQKNWIGRSHGAEVNFGTTAGDSLTVYTTRCDTLFGATYMVVSPEHAMVKQWLDKGIIKNVDAVKAYQAEAARKSDFERSELNKEKTGVKLEGVMGINPVNDTEIPIFISDYVLSTYGTGAIMAVPAHDTRDWEFAKKFGLPIIEVVQGSTPSNLDEAAFTDVATGTLVNSGFLNGLSVADAQKKMIAWLEETGKGRDKVNYKLRDWVFSRQRYWGEPIPMVHCDKCGWQPLPESSLPLTLPDITDFEPGPDGESPLARHKDWVKTTCPCCGGPATRETDTMPQWAGSSWYFLRYMDPHCKDAIASKEALEYWSPVDWYNGGMEHTTLHLLYSRFWHKFLYDIGVVPKPEPYQKRTSHGMILGLNPHAFENQPDAERKRLLAEYGSEKAAREALVEKYGEMAEHPIVKMSKSLGNVVNPDDVVNEYGADTLRLYEMFIGDFEKAAPWNTNSIKGCKRFLDRIWALSEKQVEGEGYRPKLEALINRTIKKVGEDIDALKANTAIAQLMILVNALYDEGGATRAEYEVLLQLLNPFVPHMTEELWQQMGHTDTLAYHEWPKYDEAKCVEQTIEIAVQVNGKVKAHLNVAANIESADAIAAAKADPAVAEAIAGKTIAKEIYVKGRLVNIAVKG